MKKNITVFEASRKFGFSIPRVRLLARKGVVRGRLALTNPKRAIWLIEQPSMERYCSKERKPGRKSQ